MQRELRPAVAAVLLLAAMPPTSASDEVPPLRINYLAFPVEWNGKSVMIGARLQEPANSTGRIPAVILLHGTVGVRYSGVYYATALNRAGIATLEVDQWGGRGLPGGASSRPKGLGDMLTDVKGAYRLLSERSEIDAARIALIGSSMGGIETMLMMTRHYSDAILGPGVHLKAAAALYPICWLYNHVPGGGFADLVDAPVRILVGSADDYDGGQPACETLLHDLAPADAAHLSLRIFPGATHIFDAFEGSFEYYDPTANRRQGGTIHVRPDSEVRQEARDDLVWFFTASFK
ncbi:dienelactone hydrolase family protein [Bradyrhizobium genosp. P]|uniref:dienelactone hydrolase family protein n=1 Tax=Bradyrhizobium genosp. P TaxID=83641 RepID=UPI003CECDAE7